MGADTRDNLVSIQGYTHHHRSIFRFTIKAWDGEIIVIRMYFEFRERVEVIFTPMPDLFNQYRVSEEAGREAERQKSEQANR